MAKKYVQNSWLKSITILCACSIGGCATYSQNNANPALNAEDRIQRHVYAGTGFGSSRMEPDTSALPGINVNDRVEAAGQVTLGMDLSRQLALELHSADLGSAGLTTGDRVNYHTHGASALLYVGGNRGAYKRNGITGYGRVGLGYMDNSVDGDAKYVQDNKTHLVTGAGVEYMTRIGLGLRAEGILFDQDARYAQLGLIYRTGRRAQSKPVEIVQIPEPLPTPAPTPIVAPVPAVVVAEAPIPVDNCSDVAGVLEGVNFHSNSAKLTNEAAQILDGVATRLLECDSVPVRISAHTDNVGAESYNQSLSQQRASSVVEFLSNRGISSTRLRAEAFGETQPIDSNATAEGRLRNRRVELSTEL